MQKIKNAIKTNKEKIVIVTLTVAVGALGVYSVRTKNRLDGFNNFYAPIMEGLGEGFVARLSEDRSTVVLEHPEAPKTKTKSNAA